MTASRRLTRSVRKGQCYDATQIDPSGVGAGAHDIQRFCAGESISPAANASTGDKLQQTTLRLPALCVRYNLAVYINEIELDRARLKVQSIEKDLLPTVSDPVPDAWVKTFFHGDTLDTVALFSEAVDSIRGMSANSDRCHLTLRALLAMPSSGGNMVVEKDAPRQTRTRL